MTLAEARANEEAWRLYLAGSGEVEPAVDG